MADLDPTLHTAALAALEAAINQALQLSPGAGEELNKLQGYVFKVECTSPKIDLHVKTNEGRIQLVGYYEGELTTTVRGSASDFAELATSTDAAASLINGQLAMQGDSGPLLELQSILSSLEIDWEAPLVSTLGDVVGHQIAQMLRGFFGWGTQASESFFRQLEEFIHEEARLSPPRLEMEDFYGQIQDLSSRTDRLQSRTDRLRKRLRTRLA